VSQLHATFNTQPRQKLGFRLSDFWQRLRLGKLMPHRCGISGQSDMNWTDRIPMRKRSLDVCFMREAGARADKVETRSLVFQIKAEKIEANFAGASACC